LTFQDFNFDEKLLEGLYSMGYTKPTPIQAEAIPLIQTNRDLIACAQTGTGKTAAFLLPIINKIIGLSAKQRRLNTLIISPTRELATQIDNQVEGLGYFTGISSISIYGGGDGNAWNQQKKALEEGAEIIIATPGRLMAILQMGGTIDFSNLQHLILDEADRMLDMGFYDDIIKIIKYIPAKRQTLLFSATMPPKIRKLAHSILINPEQLNIAISKPSDGILQQAYLVYDTQKINLITHILKSQNWGPVIIFASTKESVKKLDVELRRTGLKIKAFHSDLEQKEREQIMIEFKSKALQILIGTDILSRGIDVEGISLVINYTVPHDPEDYIHRIGRTARAETTGTAITFINDKDQRKFADIEDLIEREIPKLSLPAGMGDAPVYQPHKRVSSGVAGGGNFKKKPYHQKKGFVKK
jgi:ATP-dependent RNA helicase RhlE